MGLGRIGILGLNEVKEVVGRMNQPRPIVPKAVAGQFALDEAPEPLDAIEVGTVCGQPADADPVGVLRQPAPVCRRLVVGDVVQDQHQVVARPAPDQAFQKLLEPDAVAAVGHHRLDLAGAVVEGPEDGDPPVGAGGGDPPGTAPALPALRQVGMAMEGAFIQVQEMVSRSMSPLFSSVRKVCLARSTASASCRWVRSCRGRA